MRFGNVLASSGSVLPIWAEQIREGGPLTVTHPEMTRYFMTIPEAASLVIQAAALDDGAWASSPCETKPGTWASSPCEVGAMICVLDMGDPIRIVDLARRFVEAHGLEARMQRVAPGLPGENARIPAALCNSNASPGQARGYVSASGVIDIVFTGIRPGEKLVEELAYDREDLLPTTHPGIRIRRSDPPSEAALEAMLDSLHSALGATDPSRVAALIHRALEEVEAPVPEPVVAKRAARVA